MRKIINKSVECFLNRCNSNIDNTSVYQRVSGDWVMRLWNTEITQIKSNNVLFIQTGGFNTQTTFSHLNALPNVNVRMKKGILTLNGEKWDGSWKLII